jgi:hypothetical protein
MSALTFYFLRCLEAILYHTGGAVLGWSQNPVILAEHLLPETTSASKRIEFQIAAESEGLITQIVQKTHAQLMQHLCLGIDIDTEWIETPEIVWEVVLARIRGGPVLIIPAVEHWMASPMATFKSEISKLVFVSSFFSSRVKD